MSKIHRRDFLKSSIGATAALFAGCATAPHARVLGANDDVRVGVIGLRNKGQHLVRDFLAVKGARVVAVCDADTAFLDREVEAAGKRKQTLTVYQDLRRMLESPDIDAVVIAMPNFWHSLATVWACQAGKDVYVEKPVSHNIWEGRKMVEAARKYKRVVQAGTQKRSDPGAQEAFAYIQQGHLGRIKVVRGFCFRERGSIGIADGTQQVPATVNYDLWCGPTPLAPLNRKSLHYDWHWFWSTGNGEIGNQGIHEMDMCRWALGQNTLPPRVLSLGGRFGYEDDAETPNTQVAILDYEPAPIIFEVRGLYRKASDKAMDHYRNIRVGLVVECEDGYYAGGGGGWIFDHDGNRIKQFQGDGGGQHATNFIKAVRSRKTEDQVADILEGHLSSALCHMANISQQLGSRASSDEIQEKIRSDRHALETLERFQSHLEANEIDLAKTPVVLGPWLAMDAEKERFVNCPDADAANKLVSRKYRKPYIIPERV
ncbi:MAG TPA: Gfo/Idh/MocA family oxidoreductase [bacterium]|nr:Gfo/Idh/MocA family oxidoreductase [bacterium]